MEKIQKSHLDRLKRYLDEKDSANYKIHHELDLNELSKLMNKIGFEGPINKSGNVRGFQHELLKADPMLVGGHFTIHIANKKRVTVRVRDFREYMLPHIQKVINRIEELKLIEEG